MLTSLFKRS